MIILSLNRIVGFILKVSLNVMTAVINKINNEELSKVTLGGCIIEMQHETVIISKEY